MEDAEEEKALDSAKASGALFEPAKPQPGDFDYVDPGQDLRSPWPDFGSGFEPFEDEVRGRQPAGHSPVTAAPGRGPLAHAAKHTVLAVLHTTQTVMLGSCQQRPAGTGRCTPGGSLSAAAVLHTTVAKLV